MAYNYISFGDLKTALATRLQDPGLVWTTSDELGVYLTEALRVLNALTGIWNIDFVLTFNMGDQWESLNFPTSPRERTVTDSQVYTQMEYMLLEPPTGAVWTGTTQFTLNNFVQSLQYRRDELMMLTGANTTRYTDIASPVTGNRTELPDDVLDVRRVRWMPSDATPPYTLQREDRTSVNAYGDLLGITPGQPDSWMITANTPLNFDCSCTPNVPGLWDLLTLNAGTALSPPNPAAPIPLNLPNDWCWVAMYGALADLVANAPEATDNIRLRYCQERYKRGVKAMERLPWLINASTVAGLPVDTPSVIEMDAYAQNWEEDSNADAPNLVIGGMDFIALAPFIGNTGNGYGQGGYGGGGYGGDPATTLSCVITVVGNAPIPTVDTDQIQLSRNAVDQVLNYAQHIASFKRGGTDFTITIPLYEQFETYCASVNSNYSALGIYRQPMILQGTRGLDMDPLYNKKEEAQIVGAQ